uniref:DNA-directed RNA polymerase III subunit RPC3 n=1 Tax=Syphacia muris TaxID=451379 RepID=A0A0N5A9T2_9BILA
MGSYEVDLCFEILDDYFGPIVASVGRMLLKESGPLPSIAFRLRSEIRVHQIKQALVILEQHNLLKFGKDDRRIVYSIAIQDVIRLSRAARCSLTAKTLYGEAAEAICEEIFSQGRLSCSDCIRRVSTRLELPPSEVKAQFVKLVESQLIIRCPKVEVHSAGMPVFENLTFPFMMPDNISLRNEQCTDGVNGEGANGSRKRKHDDENIDPDFDIYWKLNFPRFERYLRDEMAIEAIDGECINSLLRKAARALLKICETKTDSMLASSIPISIHDVIRCANVNNMELEKCDIEIALRILSDGQKIVRKVGDSAGGLYIIDFENAVIMRCQRLIESVIREQIDSRAVRIFRLLLQKGHLEEEQVEKLAMLSSKEAKQVCYDLVEHKFASIRHIGKTNDFNTAKTIYLYNVDLSKAAQEVYAQTCKALCNVIIRRKYETKEHKSLIERNLKRETIISTIQSDPGLDDDSKQQQIAEVEETYMTNEDRVTLEKYKQGQSRFLSSEIELDKDILLLSLFLEFSKMRV